MAPRANWKGFLRLSLVTCPVALYPATSESEKVSFNQLNRKTGHRIKYSKVDADTGEEVANEDIVKGYKVDTDTFIEVTKEELENVALLAPVSAEAANRFCWGHGYAEQYFHDPLVYHDRWQQRRFRSKSSRAGCPAQSFTELVFPEFPRCSAEVSKLEDCQRIRLECEGRKWRRF
jgi:Ku70/Ku80 beta-barrel domain